MAKSEELGIYNFACGNSFGDLYNMKLMEYFISLVGFKAIPTAMSTLPNPFIDNLLHKVYIKDIIFILFPF